MNDNVYTNLTDLKSVILKTSGVTGRGVVGKQVVCK